MKNTGLLTIYNGLLAGNNGLLVIYNGLLAGLQREHYITCYLQWFTGQSTGRCKRLALVCIQNTMVYYLFCTESQAAAWVDALLILSTGAIFRALFASCFGRGWAHLAPVPKM